MERLVGDARHVEVQLMADGQGGVLGARRARLLATSAATRRSSRSRPAPRSRAEQERELADAAVRLARDAGYRGAGTVEFLYEPEPASASRSWRSTRGSRSSIP